MTSSTWPTLPSPHVVYSAPGAGGLDDNESLSTVVVRVAPMQPVVAPVDGVIAYVGDGTIAPLNGNGPGVLVVLDDEHGELHVLGNLDRKLLEATWREWPALLPWNRWGAGATQDKASLWPVPGSWDPSPGMSAIKGTRITAGAVVGRVADNRPGLRWSVLSTLGVPLSPMLWVKANALSPPVYVAAATPPPAPVVPIKKPKERDNVLLWAAAIIGGVFVLRQHRRNRHR